MANITYKRSHDDGGPRHYLDGEPISCGQGLDVLTPLGWLPGRFELAHERAELDDGQLVEDGKVPMFYAQLPVHKGSGYATGSVGASMCFRISDRHVFRWPAWDKRERRAQLAEAPPRVEAWDYCAECSVAVPPGVRRCGECEAELARAELRPMA